MKRIIHLIIYFCIAIVYCFSQNPQQLSFYQIQKPQHSGEQIILETDRDFYCVNEKIFFSVDYKCNDQINGLPWSQILYVELIRWNGEKIAQAKFKLSKQGTNGYISIPDNITSGNYYLRAYTKWMRNFPVEEYAYRIIKVLNPYSNAIDHGANGSVTDSSSNTIPSTFNVLRNIACNTNKKTYKPREKVELTLRMDNGIQLPSEYCISVAKKGTLDTLNVPVPISQNIKSKKDTLTYLPETRGISITGQILNSEDSIPLSNIRVNISTPLNYKYFSTFYTTENGYFYFTLPDFYGNHDFYIDALTQTEKKINILIDNDYCGRNTQLPYIPFSLNENERQLARQLSINMQLMGTFNDSLFQEKADSNIFPFYGSPKKVYLTKDYVDLPNLEEFIFEIIKEVWFSHKKKQTFLRLAEKSSVSHLDPLILIDNIPVANGSDFLKISLKMIEKVEIIDKPYIAGYEKYNGVISIYAKNKDFAGLKPNKNSMFFSYDLYTGGNFYSPDYKSYNDKRTVDRRNLLFWKPNIELPASQSKKLTFYTSDSKGEYLVYIRGINIDNSSFIYGTCSFNVE